MANVRAGWPKPRADSGRRAAPAQRNLLREFKRILPPGGLLLISNYPHRKPTHEPADCGTFRFSNDALLQWWAIK
jgi:hypothetical protein